MHKRYESRRYRNCGYDLAVIYTSTLPVYGNVMTIMASYEDYLSALTVVLVSLQEKFLEQLQTAKASIGSFLEIFLTPSVKWSKVVAFILIGVEMNHIESFKECNESKVVAFAFVGVEKTHLGSTKECKDTNRKKKSRHKFDTMWDDINGVSDIQFSNWVSIMKAKTFKNISY